MNSVSVVVVTLSRPDCIRRNLESLFIQSPAPEQIIVVDASPDDVTQKIVAEFPGVISLKSPYGPGHMTKGRNLGLERVTGEITAFLDDDAYARPGWLATLAKTYDLDPNIAAVGARALNGMPNEATFCVDDIGKLKPTGSLSANFGADPGEVIDVDHIIGCSMSFRTEILAQLNGLRDDFPGTEVGEDTDISLRIKALGGRIVFQPSAIVDHVGAPHVVGRRFDWRYDYFHRRNNFMLFVRHFGLSKIIGRYLALTTKKSFVTFAGALIKFVVTLAGAPVGILAGLSARARDGGPIRRDARGQEIGERLRQNRAEKTEQVLQ